MNNNFKETFIENYIQYMEQERDDLSSSFFHMTKNIEYLIEILKTRKLISTSDVPTCIPQKKRDNFKTVSFTEMPLSQILKINEFSSKTKSKKMTYYGLEFHKKNSLIIHPNLNPVLYVFNEKTKEAYCKIFSIDLQIQEDIQLIAPYLKFISSTNNFSWEREWRHLGDFTFSLYEVRYILVPEEIDADLIAERLVNYPTLHFKILKESGKIISYEFTDNLSEEEMASSIKGYYVKISIDKKEKIEETIFKTVFSSSKYNNTIIAF